MYPERPSSYLQSISPESKLLSESESESYLNEIPKRKITV